MVLKPTAQQWSSKTVRLRGVLVKPPWFQVFRYAVVGGLGVVVNMVTMVVLTRLGPDTDRVLIPVFHTEFNVRFYHMYSLGAFVVANLFNFALNRVWTFQSRGRRRVEYWRFLTIGISIQVLGLGLLTLLMHPHSPLTLPTVPLDDTTLFRTRVYWAQLITIILVTPASFIANKYWTFPNATTKS